MDKLALYMIRSVFDLNLMEDLNTSKYHVDIQTGAALTEQRICELNDYDPCVEDSISYRNKRYGEFTAWYYIWKHTNTEYVGFCHYRRRFIISDQQLDAWMNQKKDILVKKKGEYPYTLGEMYSLWHYGHDWMILMKILQKRYPEFYEYMREEKFLHRCCMGIWKKSVFDECCEFLFPIFDECWNELNEKTDVYQKRDIAYMGERLVSAWIEFHKDRYDVKEVGVIELCCEKEHLNEECNTIDKIERRTNELLGKQEIEKCINWYKDILLQTDEYSKEDYIKIMSLAFATYEYERRSLKETFFEYMPNSCDDNYLYNLFYQLKVCISYLQREYSDEIIVKMVELIKKSGISFQAISYLIDTAGFEMDVLDKIALALLENQIVP